MSLFRPMHRRAGPGVLALWLAATHAPAALSAGGPVFEDATAACGLDFTYRTGVSAERHLPEIVGPGAAWLDFDNDGDLDAFLVQGAALNAAGAPPEAQAGDSLRLFRNDLAAPGARPRFKDVSREVGLAPAGLAMGVAAGDYDNDGWTDVYVTAYGRGRLLHNDGGRRFEEATARAGIEDSGWGVSASFVDYDRDGWLDLYVAHYVDYSAVRCVTPGTRRDYCGPKSFRPRRDRLFRNLGGGRFADAAAVLGPEPQGPGLGVVATDADGDGWLDLYVANDGTDNILWRNRGGRAFEDQALFAGVALNRAGLAEAGMGTDAADCDGDGDEDLFVTNLSGETNTLYVNQGDGLYDDRTLATGLGPPSLPFTGFGTRFLDFDNDGRLDLVVVNGAVHLPDEPADPADPLPLGQSKLLFHNLGAGRFAAVTAEAGPAFARAEISRGLALGDVDNDGDPDLLVGNLMQPARLLLNRRGQDAAWLGLRLLTADGRRDALGALARLRRRGAGTLVRRVRSDGSYASAGDPRLLFGLGGGAALEALEVLWPDGTRETFDVPALRRYTTLRQGSGRKLAPGP